MRMAAPGGMKHDIKNLLTPAERSIFRKLSTPQKIDDARPLLPPDADLVEIAGASHSSFGDYGLQPGDNAPTISDDDMTAQVTESIDAFFGG